MQTALLAAVLLLHRHRRCENADLQGAQGSAQSVRVVHRGVRAVHRVSGQCREVSGWCTEVSELPVSTLGRGSDAEDGGSSWLSGLALQQVPKPVLGVTFTAAPGSSLESTDFAQGVFQMLVAVFGKTSCIYFPLRGCKSKESLMEWDKNVWKLVCFLQFLWNFCVISLELQSALYLPDKAILGYYHLL